MKVFVLVVGFFVLCGYEVAASPPVYFQLASHNEQPDGSVTTNFSNSATDYIRWREALKEFAEMCVARGIRYNCQCEWNFLEGVRKWEIEPATAIPGITTNTQSKNILLYIHDLGLSSGVPIEIDAHSHELTGYSYADVAWLVSLCGVPDTRVLGGLTLDSNRVATRFDAYSSTSGVVATKYPAQAPNWFPVMLMGGATASHVNDPHDAGLWRPASASNFFAHATNGPLVSIGHWQNDLEATDRLIGRLESGELPLDGKMWATGFLVNHRDFQAESYRTNEGRMILDTIKKWQDEGRIQSTTYLEALALWQTNFSETSSLYERPADNVSFSLNWQDFYYTTQSVYYLHHLLTLHEQLQVPVDVFLTTWQTDIIEQYPDLLGRLQSSSLVTLGYHVRPPKPYASTFLWGAITNALTDRTALVTGYETNGLDLYSGLPTTNSGGYDKLKTLIGYAPVCVGALAPTLVASNVNGVFGSMGASMLVKHSPPVNVKSRDTSSQLLFRPEHLDWKLISLWEASTNDPQPAMLSLAMAGAHASATNLGSAPWFVGIKLHDNDLFATQSQWTLSYPNANQLSWDTNRHSALLAAPEQTNRFAFYAALVAEVASSRSNLNSMNSFDTAAFMDSVHVRPIGLSCTAVAEDLPVGSMVAILSGGGGIAGQAVQYSLVAGEGDHDNPDFAISSNRLFLARALDFETNSTRSLRVRWSWLDGLDSNSVLGSGDRVMTIVVNNVDTDDDDMDGLTEAQEAIAGTDPRDSSSVLRVTTFTGTSPVMLSVYGVALRSYTVQSSTNLQYPWHTETSASLSNVPGTNALLNLIDPDPNSPQKFYRIFVTP